MIIKIVFQSPLLIGGAQGEADPQGLTAKALRGMWRFWLRVLLGGLRKSSQECFEIESDILGATESSSLRIKIKPLTALNFEKFACLPHDQTRPARKEGLGVGTAFEVSVEYRKSFLTRLERNEALLFCAVALWGALGAIGSRARRGFGSPVVACTKFKDLGLTATDELLDLTNNVNLKDSLVALLMQIRKKANQALGLNTGYTKYLGSQSSPFFQLSSIDQIFISDELGCQLYQKKSSQECGVIYQVHSSPNPLWEDSYAIRLFQLKSNQYVAVCTFCRMSQSISENPVTSFDYQQFRSVLEQKQISENIQDQWTEKTGKKIGTDQIRRLRYNWWEVKYDAELYLLHKEKNLVNVYGPMPLIFHRSLGNTELY